MELDAVGKRWGDAIAVDALTLRVDAGALVALVGGSGSGKTTTLKMVNRLVEADTGTIRVGGRDVRDEPAPLLRRRIGYCFQQIGLFPHLDVAENVGVTPRLLGWPAERIRRRVDELLALVELEPAAYRSREPASLSGGQQQRVAIARALAAEPAVLLMDEPFGALDPLTRDTLQERFQAIRRALAVTVLFVTHDMAEALRLADSIAVLDGGRLVQRGTPAELLRAPATESVARMIATPRRQAEQVEALLHAEAEGA
ncbi:MAG: glycine/betaine ABC transporter ATP-binding protein [Proteobacteria bacterium]|nr:MAG: glycine/betaine ABC transporter ATP-binding protein [Pseudomonadota bacterium]